MEFALSEDQGLLQDQLETAVSRLSTLSRVRAHAETDGAFAADIWAGFAEFGLAGMLVPEEHGGLGMGLLDAALVSEILGRHVAPVPFLGPVVAGPMAIALAGSVAQKAALLPAIAAGELRIAVAFSETMAGARAGAGVHVAGERLNGTSLFTVDVAGAHKILVGDIHGGLHLVDRDADGLEITPLITVDTTRSAAALRFDEVPAEALPGASADVMRTLQSALHVAVAADLLGAGTRMMEIAVDYAKVRQQFGRPIGSFQAVKHLCADMAAQLEPGRALVWYAAHAIDTRLADATLVALHAKAYLADASRIAARNATEVHGGIGITDELGLHYWFKRTTFGGQVFGGAARAREVAAREQAIGTGSAQRAREMAEAGA